MCVCLFGFLRVLSFEDVGWPCSSCQLTCRAVIYCSPVGKVAHEKPTKPWTIWLSEIRRDGVTLKDIGVGCCV